MKEKVPRVAVNVFVINSGKLLLGQRKNTAGDGDWGLPGGHVEYMESLMDAAKRELFEETGLEAELDFENIVSGTRHEDNKHYVHVNFLASGFKPKEPELKEPDKCYEWKWFAFNELPENIFIGHRKIIPAFVKRDIFVD